MAIDPGLGSVNSTKGFQDFFARWGAKANLRSLFNVVFPVALVDRYRGEDEGSLYGITALANGANNEHPCVFFGAISGVNTRDDVTLEVLAFTAGLHHSAGSLAEMALIFHLFTPVLPYNPVVNLDPVGAYIPGMFLNKPFTRGSGIAFGGSNPAWPAGPGNVGYQMSHRQIAMTFTPYWGITPMENGAVNLPVPIRIHPGNGLAFQLYNPGGNNTFELKVSILYRERPFFK